MSSLTVIPDYGRNLKSKKEVREYYNSNKDFRIVGIHPQAGRVINKSDAEEYGVTEIRVRYSNKTKVHIIKTGE